MVAEATLHLKGVTLRAKDASRDLNHSVNLVADELGRQVKRHRDKRRKRREQRAAAAAPQLPPEAAGGRRAAPGHVSPARRLGLYTGGMTILDRALRLGEAKQFKQYAKRVDRINAWEPELELLEDEELRAAGRQPARARPQRRGPRRPAAGDVRRWCARSRAARMGMRHFDVQMIGGMVLHAGAIAEMKTGEGKTLTGTLAVVLNALAGEGVHVVTVNDYLARRDAEWMSPIYTALGLTIGVLQNMQPYEEKRAAYAADITYGTNSEFGFDYLRDNMAVSSRRRSSTAGASPRTASRSPRTTTRSSTRSTTSSSTRPARR